MAQGANVCFSLLKIHKTPKVLQVQAKLPKIIVMLYVNSMQILDRKMTNVKRTDAEYLVANNPGCMTQIEFGCRNYNVPMKIVHLATLLREVYEL